MKKLFTLVTMLLSVTFASAQQLYICGDAPAGNGWDFNEEHQLPLTLADDGVTNTITFTAEKQLWFAISDGPGEDWADFNNNHRWGIQPNSDGAYELKEDATLQLQLLNEPTMTVMPGTYEISINAETMMMTVKVKVAERPEVDSYYVVGSSEAVFGASWNLEQDEPYMTLLDDGTYQWVKEDVELTAGNIEWKVVVNPKFSSWGEQYGADGFGNNTQNVVTAIEEDGTYTLTFKLDLSAGNESVPTAEVQKAGETGIATVKQTPATAVVYNLAGQRVGADYKGLVIKNGKKMMVK